MNHFEKKDGIEREVYYHYTSLDALYSIVSSKTFRLTSLASSNDKAELYYKLNDFLDDLKAVACELNMQGSVFDDIDKSLRLHEKDLKKISNRLKTSYAFSLSNKVDNLTHWERYANGCTGVCIGINTAALKVYYERKDISFFADNLFEIGKTLYSKEERLLKIINYIKYYSKVIFKKYDNSIFLEKGYLLFIYLYISLQQFAKNSAFTEENEFRIYYDEHKIDTCLKMIDTVKDNLDKQQYLRISTMFNMLINELDVEKRNYAVTSKGIRSYHNLCLSEIWGNGLIPEICLGRLCVQNINELKLFLKDNGLSGCKVTKSNVPIN